MKTKEKILVTSIELFNRNGTQSITTNHISKAMGISPGNLYFHYDNKEAILRELFKRMTSEIYDIWRPRKVRTKPLLVCIEENFELYWKYRFLHREMYALRRKDPELSQLWSVYLKKVQTLMMILYRNWVKDKMMVPLHDKGEMEFVIETLLTLAGAYLQFFEGSESSGQKGLEKGQKNVARFLLPYTLGETQESLGRVLNLADCTKVASQFSTK